MWRLASEGKPIWLFSWKNDRALNSFCNGYVFFHQNIGVRYFLSRLIWLRFRSILVGFVIQHVGIAYKPKLINIFSDVVLHLELLILKLILFDFWKVRLKIFLDIPFFFDTNPERNHCASIGIFFATLSLHWNKKIFEREFLLSVLFLPLFLQRLLQ